jgi:hypothetical protein
MAIKGNSSDQKFFQDIKLYTGPSAMRVVGICPTLGELQAIGFKFDKEVTYIGDKDGTNTVRIDVVFKSTVDENFKGKAAFFLENKERVSAKGSKEITNNFGQSTWAATVEDALEKVGKNGNKWFKPNGARVALVGEVQLITFLRDWLNVSPEDESTIDSYDNLFKGNFKELQQYVKMQEKNTIYTLATVKDGKYQQIHTGFFARSQFSLPTVMRKLMTYVEDQKKAGYPLKDSFSYDFKEYTPQVVSPDPEPAEKHDEPNF